MDPNDANKQNPNQILDTNVSISDLLTKLKDNSSVKQFTDSIKDLNISASDLTSIFKEATTSFDDLKQSLNESSIAQELFNQNSQEILLTLNSLGVAAFKTTDSFNAFSESMGNAGVFSNAKTSYQALKEEMKALGLSADNSSSAFSKITSVIDKYGSKFLSQATAGQQLELGMISLASASGELGSKLGLVGENFERLPELSAQFSEKVGNIALSTGLSTQNITNFINSGKDIPGLLNQVTVSSETTNKTMTATGAALALAAASGRKQSEVIDDLRKAYNSLNLSADEAVKYVALINESSARLNLRISDTHDYFNNLIDDFKFLGNQAGDNQNVMEGAARTLERYSEALKNTGLSSSATSEIIRDMNKSIGSLDTATKSFLSNRSGLGGGLQGAFKIDLLRKEGKTDEIVKLIEEELKKEFGGKIVTLEQAANDQASAAQYQKQLALINQGPLKGFVGNGADADLKAGRLFEALASGKVGEAKQQITATDALEKSIDKGTNLQERQITELSRIQVNTERSANLAAITAAGILRNTFGVNAEGSNLKEALEKARSISVNLEVPNTPKEQISNVNKDLVSSLGAGANGTEELLKQFGGVFASFGDVLKNVGKISSSDAKDAKDTGKGIQKIQDENKIKPFVDNAISNTKEPDNKRIVLPGQDKTPSKNNTEDTFGIRKYIEEGLGNTLKNIVINVHQLCPECHKKGLKNEIHKVVNDGTSGQVTQLGGG